MLYYNYRKENQKKINTGRIWRKVEIMTVQEIQEICKKSDYEYFGLRADNKKYNISEICENSHQLLQDPDFDEYGGLVFPYITDTESPYHGFYDAGELDGTCAVEFDPEDENSIKVALDIVAMYSGENIYIIAGDYTESGNDEREIIITDAEVIGRGKKYSSR